MKKAISMTCLAMILFTHSTTAAVTNSPIPTHTVVVTAVPTVSATAVPTIAPVVEQRSLSDEFIAAMDCTVSEPLTYAEILNLESDVEKAVMAVVFASDTELPMGRYVVGEDLLAGNYVITATSDYSSPKVIVVISDLSQKEIERYELKPGKACNVILADNQTLLIESNSSYEIHALIRNEAQ